MKPILLFSLTAMLLSKTPMPTKEQMLALLEAKDAAIERLQKEVDEGKRNYAAPTIATGRLLEELNER